MFLVVKVPPTFIFSDTADYRELTEALDLKIANLAANQSTQLATIAQKNYPGD